MVAVASAELGAIVEDLRELLSRIDALLDDALPSHAGVQANAAREQLVNMIEDAFDLIEVDEALREAGGKHVDWEEYKSQFPPAAPN